MTTLSRRAMPDQDLFNMMTNTWKDHAGTWSGIVGHLHRMISQKLGFSLVHFIADTLLSGFCAVAVFWLLYNRGIDPLTVVFISGVAAHTAPRTMWIFERTGLNWLRRIFGKAGNGDEPSQRP